MTEFLQNLTIVFLLQMLMLSGCSKPGEVSSSKYLQTNNLYQDAGMRKVVIMIQRGDLTGVKAWVTSGGKVDTAGTYGVTPLYLAWFYRQKEIYDYLLTQGADIDTMLNFNLPPVEFNKSNLIPRLAYAVSCDSDAHYLKSALKYGLSQSFALECVCHSPSRKLDQSTSFQQEEERYKLDTLKIQMILDSITDKSAMTLCCENCLLMTLAAHISKFGATIQLLDFGVPISGKITEKLLAKALVEYQDYEKTGKCVGILYSSFELKQLERLAVYLQSIDPDIMTKMMQIEDQYNRDSAIVGGNKGFEQARADRQKINQAAKKLEQQLHEYFVEFNKKRGL